LGNILSSNADMPGLNIEISIIIYDLILRMREINWIFQLVDGDCVKADFYGYRHNSVSLLNTLKMPNVLYKGGVNFK